MDKRLVKLLKSGIKITDTCMLDTYNQSVQNDTACTIRTNINTANHHFIVEKEERMSEIKYIGQMSSSQNSRVIDSEGISYAVTNGHKDGEPKIIERNTPMKGNYKEPRICTMVGRDPNNPSSRAKSEHYEQMLELGDDISNTLTSVQKDNLVAEPNVLTPKRTEFGKQVRKKYESGELEMSRHEMTELEVRQDGVSNTLTSVQKDNLVAEPIILDDIYKDREPRMYKDIAPTQRSGHDTMKVAEPLRIPQATKQGYIEVPPGAVFDMSYPDSTTRRGRVQDGGKVSPTLMAGGETPCLFEGVAENTHIKEVAEELKQMATDARKEPIEVTINKYGSLRPHKLDKAKTGVSEFQVENEEDTASTLISARPNKTYGISTSYRIRKLTPRECFRLMGVSEKDIDKIQDSGVSQSQQYKMAGNSIVVDCLYHMFRKLFTETACESQQLSLF